MRHIVSLSNEANAVDIYQDNDLQFFIVISSEKNEAEKALVFPYGKSSILAEPKALMNAMRFAETVADVSL